MFQPNRVVSAMRFHEVHDTYEIYASLMVAD